MSEWISVEEGYPNECMPVIATNGAEAILCTFYENKFSQDTSVAEAYGGNPLDPLLDFDVTHWMPLPEPPQ